MLCKGHLADHVELKKNGVPVVMKDEQKHLGMILNSALNFHNHVKEKIVHVGESE